MDRSYAITILCIVALLSFAPFAGAQQVSLSKSSLTFAPQLVGTVSAPQSFTVTNSGTQPLTIGSIAASGGYSVSTNCSILSPGATCTTSVRFISGLVGTDNGTITINDNAVSSPQIVSLSGSALAPLVLSPEKLNLGSATVSTISPAKSMVLTNNGPVLSIGRIAVSGDYLQTNNCASPLASGASCTINVAFRPTSTGAIGGALSINGSGSGVSASLSGTGVGNLISHVSLQPSILDFGSKSAGDIFTHEKTITLSNTSNSLSLSIQSVLLTGPVSATNVPVYQVSSTDCKGLLAPGGHCQITVSVGNLAPVPDMTPGALTIVDSDPTSPQVVSLSTTQSPEVAFAPANLSFAPQKVGTSSTAQIVTLSSNLDETGVSLLPLAVSGDYQVVSAGSNPCGNSPAFSGVGSTCTIGVIFSPKQVGIIHGAVTFTFYPECQPEQVLIFHKPCPESQVINLTGVGQ